MRKKLQQNDKMVAYALNKKHGYNQNKIALMLDVSSSTVSRAIEQISYEKQIYDLTSQLEEANNYIINNGYSRNNQYLLPPNQVFNQQNNYIEGTFNNIDTDIEF